MSTLALVNIAAWLPERVASWIKGLDGSVASYSTQFLAAGVTGDRLLALTNDELEQLGVVKVGHQETLLQSIALLQTLNYELGHETLLSLALDLSCRARNLCNEINAIASRALSVSHMSLHSDLRQKYVSLLSCVSHTVAAIKNIASLIDRIPFEQNKDRYNDNRAQLIGFGLRLLDLSRDETLLSDAKLQESIMSVCRQICELCNFLVTESVDPLVIQPSSLELVTVHKKPEDDLGIDLKVSLYGVHIVGRITVGSNASVCKKIEEGDEIIYVNGHTIVGWEQQNVLVAFKENTKDITMILKKRPCHVTVVGFQKKQQPRKELPKLNIGPKLRRSYGRKSKKNASGTSTSQLASQFSVDSVASISDHLSIDDNLSDNDVFNSATPSPSALHAIGNQPKMRRATVSGASPKLTRAVLSDNDLPSCVSDMKARPKSYFPGAGGGVDYFRGVADWQPVTPDVRQKKMSDGASDDQSPGTNAIMQQTIPTPDVTSPMPGTYLPHKQIGMVGATEIADWDDQRTASPQLIGIVRIDSCRRTEIAERERKLSVDLLECDRSLPAIAHVNGNVPQKSVHKDKDLAGDQTSAGLMRKKNFLHKVIGVSRRISCKDLGGGDCQGWLWKKKDGSGLRAGRWAKYWFVLHSKNLFFYKDPEDTSAQGVIHLTGFTVSPTESRSKKYAFKASKSETTFFFASERRDDMAKWMNKISLATLPDYSSPPYHRVAAFTKSERGDYNAVAAYYSESDEEILSPSTQAGGSKAALSPLQESLSSVAADSKEDADLTDLLKSIRMADLTVDGSSFKLMHATLLRIMSLHNKDPNSEKLCRLLCLKRMLKDKQQILETVDGLLHALPVTSSKLCSFCHHHPNLLSHFKLPVGIALLEDDHNDSSTTGSEPEAH